MTDFKDLSHTCHSERREESLFPAVHFG